MTPCGVFGCPANLEGHHVCSHSKDSAMDDFNIAFATAIALILALDRELIAIVCRSLLVSLSAVGLATIIGLLLGAMVAVCRFPGRAMVGALLNAMMGLPPVVVGLVLYLLLSRSGPLGGLALLYT